ncbi:hypothetical protein BP5796_08570 [Coleophoma crateriformis]|uniref:triacylglycerol lipase n=1 Tax=Coleophoma crateriformis TaxID=565419 RepID=A0A3D8R7Z1_9HELO|nr:hypothetical protein BP5796_08570 [Coleophoma crateriformis]
MTAHRAPCCNLISAGRIAALLFIALSSASSLSQLQQPFPILSPFPSQPDSVVAPRNEHLFSLRHIFHHGTNLYPDLHKQFDIHPDYADSTMWLESDEGVTQKVATPLLARSRPMSIHRLKDRRPMVVDPMVAAARDNQEVWALSASAWTLDDISGPNITDKDTVITFAQMAANAYVPEPSTGDWKDVNGGFNVSQPFGWESDGLRGYIYTNEDQSVAVIGLKGTSLAVFDGDGTTTNDKENDNLFFSCCCGQQGSSFYRQVCDCATSTYTCNLTCLTKSLRKENRYYAAARHLYANVTALYPNSQIWMSGHSLGGAVSSMLGLTYGLPVVTYQAVPDALPASRLGLPTPPGSDPSAPQKREYTGAYHFGHTADPIYMGTCNGATASCSYAGYAMESACHTGTECVYDVVGDKGWRVNIATHRIIRVIEDILKVYDTVPECKYTPECQDCPLWKEVTGNETSSTTTQSSTTTTKTRTRTSTCQTPGWWGCLDESTTTSASTTTTSKTTTTTSTCKTPGWFGCNDEVTTTSKIISLPPTPTTTSTTTTCHSKAFWGGCLDPTSTQSSVTSAPTSTDCKSRGLLGDCKDESTSSTLSHSITSPPPMPTATATSSATSSHSCTSKEWFGLICVDPSPTGSLSPSPTHAPHDSHCVERSWLGYCKEWTDVDVSSREEI